MTVRKPLDSSIGIESSADSDFIAGLISELRALQPDSALAKQLWDIGLLTGWRQRADGSFGPENFERGLLLYRMVAEARPKRILEVGTGRGFGSIVMATSAEDNGLDTIIDTIDLLSSDTYRDWPIQLNGYDEVGHSSPSDLWQKYFKQSVLAHVNTHTGDSNKVLKRLLKDGVQYDMIFIDAGHDPYHAILDLTYGIAMLEPGGIGLLDDFAPEAPYGLGAVMALPHLKKYFHEISVVATSGEIWPIESPSEYPHGMVLLSGRKNKNYHIERKRLLWWRIMGRLMDLSYSGRRAFPLLETR
jgi:predicted O-methyltransferase YrrM